MNELPESMTAQLLDRMRSIAEREEQAEETLARAAEDAERLREAAERHANEIVAKAHADAALIVAQARENGQRILADVEGQATGNDTRERASGPMFSDLWSNKDGDAASLRESAKADGFFEGFDDRDPGDVFRP